MQNPTPLAWLIGNEGTPNEIRFELVKSESKLGRGSNCEIQVDDKLASRNHAVIYFRDGGFEIEDLGSSNGTFVNNKAITSGPILNGDLITIGDTVLQFRIELDPDATILQMRVPQDTIAAARKTIPQEYDFVHCSACGQKNPANNKLCSKCNAVLPQLPENFKITLGIFRKAQVDFNVGQLTEEEYHKALAELVVQDRKGEYWMLGVDSGDWYWFDGEEWNKRTPPLVTSEKDLAPTPTPSKEPLPPTIEKSPTKPSKAGRWGVIGLWLISLIIVLGLGVYAAIELISFFQEPREYQPEAYYEEITTEDYDYSSSTDSDPDDDQESPADEGPILPTETLEAIPDAEQIHTEMTFRTYNPGTDSSLPSFTAGAEWNKDQSTTEYFLYEGNFPANTSAVLVMGWCAIDQDTLNENMSGIQLAGMFDNEVIPQNSWTQENTQVENMFCRFFRAVVEGLDPGTHHYIYSTSHSNPINDGWETYPPGNYISENIIEVGGQ